ncbi:glucosylglycerol 3-phosphatase [Pseudomonas dryadis]|uniref:Glucosylglycerol 3-phosphatase n=2 Tax=Phytopseudomonas dryadis TaxID=2487520 RepID=A0A4Q9QXJ6_9GAMM|nr:glucosylglycerol 3-phosphatase [Pseudomonas dryadis]
MMQKSPAFSLDHSSLLDSLTHTDNLLIIQDLDGVCMDLVRDPLTRFLDRRYVLAARQLRGHFQVLTNGEHIGSRGVNGLVERAVGSAEQCRAQGLYLPGLGAGGVQSQDRHGQVRHPGVSAAELDFLGGVPQRLRAALGPRLSQPPYHLASERIEALLAASVLDNPASPTLNINAFYQHWQARPALYRHLQDAVATLMQALLDSAARAGLDDAFFVHYAPNLGRDDAGNERLRPAGAGNAGTTDFQFMLKGAVKEAGVLVILNQHYQRHTGVAPLGEDFNVRQAPREPAALLQLARERFDPAQMPRIVGVGDTLTSASQTDAGQTRQLRGGSDRGFLTLVQQLGSAFARDNRVLYVDSSRGEVQRPGLDLARLRHCPEQPWLALEGISDADDPLRLDVLFDAGPSQYVAFFCALAQARAERRGARPR